MSRYVLVFILLLHVCAVVHQDQLKIADVGDTVYLPCLGIRDTKTTIVWIKHNPGEKPVVIATSYQNQPATIRNGFEKSGRFKAQTSADSFNLTISNLEVSDTATYYCAVIFFYDITFGEGTVLTVKGNNTTVAMTDNTCFLKLIYSNTVLVLVIVLVVAMWCKTRHSAGSPTGETFLDTHGAYDGRLNFAELGSTNKPASFRDIRKQKLKDSEVCSQVIYQQQN